MTSALVLAGGNASWSGVPKALLTVGGCPLLLRTLQALSEIPALRAVAVVVPRGFSEPLPPSVRVVPGTSDLWANVLAGLDALRPQPDEFVLLCAADMPFVTGTALQRFLDMAWASHADVVYLAVPLAAVQRLCGDQPPQRTSVRLRDGELTGGNVLLMRAGVVPQVDALARQAVRWRKSPWRLGRLAGWQVLWRFLTGRLTVADLERRAEELLGCRCKALVADLPELAFDVDKPADYALAQRLLSPNG